MLIEARSGTAFATAWISPMRGDTTPTAPGMSSASPPATSPRLAQDRPDLVARALTPDYSLGAHVAALGLVFYTADAFPPAYRGGAFVALHGSWNAATPTGYKVVRIKFTGKRPAAGYENFVTGWWRSGNSPAKVWGRPVGLAVARDGSLLIADDTGKAIWRISYTGKN